jgi:hypothetical protein
MNMTRRVRNSNKYHVSWASYALLLCGYGSAKIVMNGVKIVMNGAQIVMNGAHRIVFIYRIERVRPIDRDLPGLEIALL